MRGRVFFFLFSFSFFGLGGCKSMEELTKCSVTNPNIGSHGKEIQKKRNEKGGGGGGNERESSTLRTIKVRQVIALLVYDLEL